MLILYDIMIMIIYLYCFIRRSNLATRMTHCDGTAEATAIETAHGQVATRAPVITALSLEAMVEL